MTGQKEGAPTIRRKSRSPSPVMRPVSPCAAEREGGKPHDAVHKGFALYEEVSLDDLCAPQVSQIGVFQGIKKDGDHGDVSALQGSDECLGDGEIPTTQSVRNRIRPTVAIGVNPHSAR